VKDDEENLEATLDGWVEEILQKQKLEEVIMKLHEENQEEGQTDNQYSYLHLINSVENGKRKKIKRRK